VIQIYSLVLHICNAAEAARWQSHEPPPQSLMGNQENPSEPPESVVDAAFKVASDSEWPLVLQVRKSGLSSLPLSQAADSPSRNTVRAAFAG